MAKPHLMLTRRQILSGTAAAAGATVVPISAETRPLHLYELYFDGDHQCVSLPSLQHATSLASELFEQRPRSKACIIVADDGTTLYATREHLRMTEWKIGRFVKPVE